jgi:NAD(P)-dependent dehydrogenase (short-subunit alcohol dehydrogenase family)
MGRVEGKAAIVVGAGQASGETYGNGRATAVLLAREGARLVLVDRDLNAAGETAEIIRSEGGTSIIFAADWTDPEACKAFAAACVDAYGRIDILHNNVGIGGNDKGPEDATGDSLDTIFAINLKGCLLSCQAVVPQMRAQQSGSIVNISSVSALLVDQPSSVGYKIAKMQMIALSQSLCRTEAAAGIRVNTILPGLMDTPMAIERVIALQDVDRETARAAREARVPLKGVRGNGWDTAYASLFLHSDEANFITGIVLPVDGGQTAIKM